MDDIRNRFLTLHEVVAAARLNLSPHLWNYVVGATGTETTAKRNRLALDRIGFRPRVLVDVETVDPSADFWGKKIRIPVTIAPVGGLDQLGRGGGVTVAKGAAAAGIPFIVSSVTNLSIAEIAAGGSGPKVFQLYVRGDEAFVDDHIEQAIASGYDAFCITVDSAHYSRRERDITNRFTKPWRAANTGMNFQASLSWKDIERVRAKYPDLKLILKGIATAEDADRACDAGVDVVYVSNHGGRQLDHGAGSIEVLPEVVDAVEGRAKVWVDGGVCRGSDVVKAIALGADLVGIGRLYCYGYAAAGAEGIARVIELLEIEIVETLGLLGLTSFKGLNHRHLRHAEPVTPPHVLSAFPHLDLGEK
jgi:glycolate oxidase